MLEKIKKDFKTITWVLIPVAIGINGVAGWVVAKLDLPAYLDTIGTIFIAVVAGPFAGAITGVITNMILGFVSPAYIPYWPVPLLVGLVAGFFARAGWFKRWWKVVIVGFIIALTAAITSTLIAIQAFGGTTLNPSYFLIEEPVDKITTAMIAFLMIQILPKHFLARLPRAENLEAEEGAGRTQLYIATGIVLLLALFTVLIMGSILGG